jgi:hypothetical protein
MKYKLVIVDNNPLMYFDMAQQVQTMLGDQAQIVDYKNDLTNSRTVQYIFFGTAYSKVQIPPGSVLTNFDNHEVIFEILTPELLQTCAEVWDYSRKNLHLIQQIYPTLKSKFIDLGYSPLMDFDTGYQESEKDIDILFLGNILPRRKILLKEIQEKGVVLEIHNKKYGKERADLVSRSRICVSIYNNHVTECVSSSRFAPILSNNGFIIAETCSNPSHEEKWSQFVVSVPYTHIVQTAMEYLKLPDIRKEMADKFYDRFKSTPPLLLS